MSKTIILPTHAYTDIRQGRRRRTVTIDLTKPVAWLLFAILQTLEWLLIGAMVLFLLIGPSLVPIGTFLAILGVLAAAVVVGVWRRGAKTGGELW